MMGILGTVLAWNLMVTATLMWPSQKGGIHHLPPLEKWEKLEEGLGAPEKKDLSWWEWGPLGEWSRKAAAQAELQSNIFVRLLHPELSWQLGEYQLAPLKRALAVAGAVGSAWLAPKVPGAWVRALQAPDWRPNFGLNTQ